MHNSLGKHKNQESDESPNYLKSKYYAYQAKEPKNIKTEPNLIDLKRDRAFNYGNSYEAPTYMKNCFTSLDKKSYDNPYVEFGEKWPLLAKINNKLNNENDFRINENPIRNKNNDKSVKMRTLTSFE